MLDFILLVLGGVGLADILVNQEIALPIRELVGIYHDEKGVPLSTDGSFVARALFCIRCTGVWTALLLTLIRVVSPRMFRLVAGWLGAAYLGWRIS